MARPSTADDERLRAAARWKTVQAHYVTMHTATARGEGQSDVKVRGTREAPIPIRLAVIDALADTALTTLAIERTIRLSLGFAERPRAARRVCTHVDLHGGMRPVPAVLNAAGWIALILPASWDDLVPDFREHVWSEGGRLIRQARGLLGLNEPRTLKAVADCHVCGTRSSVALNPRNSDEAVCVGCRNVWRRSEGEWQHLGVGIPAAPPQLAAV